MNRIKHSILAILIMGTVLTSGMMTGCAQIGAAYNSPANQSAIKYGLITASIASALINAKMQVSQAETAIISRQSDYSAQQWAQLAYSDKQINQAVDLIDNLSKGPGGAGTAVLVNLAELTQVYATTKSAYVSARAIVVPNLAKFTPDQRAQLSQLDASAQALDQGAQELAAAPNGTNLTPMLLAALQVAALSAKVMLAAGIIAP
jgi:hypothetical protein